MGSSAEQKTEKIQTGCRMIKGSTHGKAPQISMSHRTTELSAKDSKFCATKRWGCWYNVILVKPVFLICLWDHHNVGLTFKLKVGTIETETAYICPSQRG